MESNLTKKRYKILTRSNETYPTQICNPGREVTNHKANIREFVDINNLPSNNVMALPHLCDASCKNSVDILCEQLGSVGMNEGIQDRSMALHVLHAQNDHSVSVNDQTHTPTDAIDIYTQDKDGDTILHTAIILQETDFVMICINIAPSNTWLSFRNLLFQTPLHLAILTNQIAIVRRLIVGGADIESRDKDGNTALHIACREGFTKMVETVLEPVQYIETNENKYELPYQKIPQNLEIRNYEGLVCLHLAAAYGHLEIVLMLIDRGADINAKEGKTGRTILHNACLDGNLDLVKLLLRYKDCDINARAYDDFTPFDFARARSHNGIIMELAVAGARYGDEDDLE